MQELVERHHPLVISSGFHELIEPVSAREGVEVELLANRLHARPGGCGASGIVSSASPAGRPASARRCRKTTSPYAGDGYSDRCAALGATPIFATGALAGWLHGRDVAVEQFEDSYDMLTALDARKLNMTGQAAEVVSDAGIRRCSTRFLVLARRGVFVLVTAALIAALTAPAVSAHAGLLSSNPAAGATLGAAPTEVTMSLSERPVPALSSIIVADARGNAYQTGRPELSTGDPLTLVVLVRPLARGVYTVRWRVDSAVDGHATTGAYQFGVQVPLSGVRAAQHTTTAPVTSTLELVARWILLVGLVVLLGAATAAVGRFGGSGKEAMLLAGCGWVLAAIGLVLLADAQRRNAGSSLGARLGSPVGHALIWRGVAIGAAGAALLVALCAVRIRRAALAAAGIAALAAVIVHVANGQGGASRWASGITVAVQAVHFAVAGVWIGGLAALLVGIRGAPSAEEAAAVRRFSIVAAAGLGVIVATGIARAFSELRGWDELVTSGMGGRCSRSLRWWG